MRSRTVRQLLRWILLAGIGGYFQCVNAASATATITANIVGPPPEHHGLILSSSQLDLRNRPHDTLTISNRSREWQALSVLLEFPEVGNAACGLRYSPTNFSIPPGGYQVVRIERMAANGAACPAGHQLIITAPQQRDPMRFEVPVATVQE